MHAGGRFQRASTHQNSAVLILARGLCQEERQQVKEHGLVLGVFPWLSVHDRQVGLECPIRAAYCAPTCLLMQYLDNLFYQHATKGIEIGVCVCCAHGCSN